MMLMEDEAIVLSFLQSSEGCSELASWLSVSLKLQKGARQVEYNVFSSRRCGVRGSACSVSHPTNMVVREGGEVEPAGQGRAGHEKRRDR